MIFINYMISLEAIIATAVAFESVKLCLYRGRFQHLIYPVT